jgi:hypothetical protein
MTLIRQMLEIELIWIGQLGLDISYMEGMYMKPVWSAKLLRSYRHQSDKHEKLKRRE